MAGPPPKMHKGIQFVKSSESFKPESTIKNAADYSVSQQTSSFSNSSALLATPKSTNGGVGNSQQIRPLFGGPAVHFGKTYNQQAFVKSGDHYSSLKKEQGCGNVYRMPQRSDMSSKDKPFIPPIPKTTTALPVCSKDEYLKAWKEEKDPLLEKVRKLAFEIISLKSERPNAMDKFHSAANRVPVQIEFSTEPVLGPKNTTTFKYHVLIESVYIATGQGSKIKTGKADAYEMALHKILMPYMRIVSTDPNTKALEVSKSPFTSPPRMPSTVPLQNKSVVCQQKESNLEASGLKRRFNEYKNLDEFVIVEPKFEMPDCTAAHTLRRSADFNHMLLEYEYFFKFESARCVLKIENEVLADVGGSSKAGAKNNASAVALAHLKKFCWIIKTKKAVDSNSTISKDEIFSELCEQSDIIDTDNIGNKMLRKMGWSGGGVGKDGDGIAEPVSLKSVLNREGLGLGTSKGITDDFRRRIKEVIENYASSDNQEDLVFSSDFRLDERQIIHDECRRLNLRSKSKGKGNKRYLLVRRKRSVNQLFDHLMSVGGETTRYQLVPPGSDAAPTSQQSHFSKPFAHASSSSPQSRMDSGNNFVNNSPRPLMPSHTHTSSSTSRNNGSGSSGGDYSQFGNNAGGEMNSYRQGNNAGGDRMGGRYSRQQASSSGRSDFGANDVPSYGNGHSSYNQQGSNSGGFRNDSRNHTQRTNASGLGHNDSAVGGNNNQRGYYPTQNDNRNDNSYNTSSTSQATGHWDMSGHGQGFGSNGQGQGYDGYGNYGTGHQGYGNTGQGHGLGQDNGQGFRNSGQGHGFGMNGQAHGYSNNDQGTGSSSSSYHSHHTSHQGNFRAGFRQ